MTQDKQYSSMDQLVDWHIDRLGIQDKKSAKHNLLSVFMPTVLEIESSGNYQAANKVSTARGGFQFIEGSVEPALNRLERRIGKQDWGTELREHKDASKLTDEQQQLLFVADLLEKKGSDAYMKKVMAGDKQGSMDAYYDLHHTAPDEATTKRTEEIFGNVYDDRSDLVPYEDTDPSVPKGLGIVGKHTTDVGDDVWLTNWGKGTITMGEANQMKEQKEIYDMDIRAKKKANMISGHHFNIVNVMKDLKQKFQLFPNKNKETKNYEGGE